MTQKARPAPRPGGGDRLGARAAAPEKNGPSKAGQADTRSRKRKPGTPSGPNGGHGTAEKTAAARRLFGLHPVAHAWQNPQRTVHRLIATAAACEALRPALDRAAARGLHRPTPELQEPSVLDALLPPGAVHQGLVLECAPLPTPSLEQLLPRLPEQACVLLLDQVTDPHNAGAVLRSAAAFQAAAVIVPDRHAPDITGALAKSAAGAVEHVPMVRVPNLARAMVQLKDADFWLLGLSEHAPTDLANLAAQGADRYRRLGWVLGAEGTGLRRLTMEHCDVLVRLPTAGPLPSLNVSNAAAIALYEWARGRT